MHETPLIQQLADHFAPADRLTEPAVCREQALSGPGGERLVPRAVLFPRDTAQVAAALAAASRTGTPLVVRGSSRSGVLPAPRPEAAVLLSTARMNRLERIEGADRMATVQSGVRLDRLAEALTARGVCFPAHPLSHPAATVGGCAARASGGPATLGQGVFKQFLAGAELVTADGRILGLGAGTLKNVVGFDLTGLICGSAGTLGVITRLTLRVAPRPVCGRTLVAAFASLERAAAALAGLAAAAHPPHHLALVDASLLHAAQRAGAPLTASPAAAVLLARVQGIAEVVRERAAALERDLCAAGAVDLDAAADETPAGDPWQRRSLGLAALEATPGGLLTRNLSVPRERAPELIQRLQALDQGRGGPLANLGHCGAGVFQPVVRLARMPAAGAEALMSAIGAAARACDGTAGPIGNRLAPESARYELDASDPLASVITAVKALFDPAGILPHR